MSGFFCGCLVLATYHSDVLDTASVFETLFWNYKRTATKSTLDLCFDDTPVLQLELDPSLLINVHTRSYYATTTWGVITTHTFVCPNTCFKTRILYHQRSIPS